LVAKELGGLQKTAGAPAKRPAPQPPKPENKQEKPKDEPAAS
jgi:hypothetical protein